MSVASSKRLVCLVLVLGALLLGCHHEDTVGNKAMVAKAVEAKGQSEAKHDKASPSSDAPNAEDMSHLRQLLRVLH